MKRGVLILLFGLAVGAVSYCCVFRAATAPARTLERTPKPELAWLKEEFKLSGPDFQRVSQLHDQYLPRCHEMCLKIDAENTHLQELISSATNMTPQIETALANASRLRFECQTMMMRHFFQVSQTMPAEQRHRYLEWVKEKAFMPEYGMDHRK